MKNPESSATQWHPAFRAAMKLELRRYKDVLEFRDEFVLGDEPNIADLMVIRRAPGGELDADRVWGYMKGHNIFEFKSPEDGLSIDDFYKTLGYACEYKSMGRTVNEIKSRDVTLTLVREGRPSELMRVLSEGEGASLTPECPGVWAVEGFAFTVRIIAYGELEPTEEDWLPALTSRLRAERAPCLLDSSQALSDTDDIKHAEAVLFVSLRENLETFEALRREKREMIKYDAYKLLFEKDFEDDLRRVRNEGMALGRSEGMALGIIRMGRDSMLSDDKIVSSLVSNLGCSEGEAERLMREN